MEEFTLIVPDGGRHGALMSKHRDNPAQALLEPLLAHERILRRIIDAQLGEWLRAKLLDLRDPNAMRDRALIRLKQLPERETLHAWDDELCRAFDGAADEQILSVLLATMLDGFPRGMLPNAKTYVGGALLVLGGFPLSPEILAAAIFRIWRKNRFPPTIAELVDECECSKRRAVDARRVVTKMIALLDNAEEVLTASGDFDASKNALPN